jgi:hypothetical protein
VCPVEHCRTVRTSVEAGLCTSAKLFPFVAGTKLPADTDPHGEGPLEEGACQWQVGRFFMCGLSGSITDVMISYHLLFRLDVRTYRRKREKTHVQGATMVHVIMATSSRLGPAAETYSATFGFCCLLHRLS